jgi:hypothetical protein
MEADEDEYSDTSSANSSGSPSSQSSATSIDSIKSALLAEKAAEMERRREMLDLSVTKIQTINTSHVPVCLRKSVLIYNTMKSLQRDLNNYDNGVYGSLMEEDMVGTDLEMDGIEEEDNIANENCATEDCEMEAEPHDYTEPTPVMNIGWASFDHTVKEERQQWTWNSLADNLTAHDMTRTVDMIGSSGGGWSCASVAGRASPLLEETSTASEQYYNPLTYNNLAQCDWMHMFGMQSSNSLLSQA